jgi:hypothetical protein
MAKDQERKVQVRDFCSSEKITAVLKHKDPHDLNLVIGMLAAVAKGGRAVHSDEKLQADAKKFSDILMGTKEGVLASKDADRIAEIVNAFTKPPSRQ